MDISDLTRNYSASKYKQLNGATRAAIYKARGGKTDDDEPSDLKRQIAALTKLMTSTELAARGVESGSATTPVTEDDSGNAFGPRQVIQQTH